MPPTTKSDFAMYEYRGAIIKNNTNCVYSYFVKFSELVQLKLEHRVFGGGL